VHEWEPYDERDRLEVVKGIVEQHPQVDLANSLSGALAGPASPDRPDVPVWNYLELAQSDPSVSLAQLSAVRFPVLFFEGESSVDSVDEHLRPPPSHLKVQPPPMRVVIDAPAVIRRFAMERDAGLVEWDPRSRGVRYLVPVAERTPVLQAWFETLAPA